MTFKFTRYAKIMTDDKKYGLFDNISFPQLRLLDCWPSQGGSSVLVLLVILDVARCYLWLFTLYINIKIGKNSC